MLKLPINIGSNFKEKEAINQFWHDGGKKNLLHANIFSFHFVKRKEEQLDTESTMFKGLKS